MKRQSTDKLCAVLVAFTMLLPAAAVAGEWNLTPRFAIDQEVTDNVQQNGIDPTGDYITQLRPGFSLRGQSSRVQSNIDYNFLHSLFARGTQLDESNHQLQGSAAIQVIKNHVTINSNSTISQQLTDSQGIVNTNNRSRSGNRSDVTRYSVGPEVRYSLGRWIDATYNFNFDSASFSDQTQRNSGGTRRGNFGSNNNGDQFSHELSLQSGNQLARLPLGFNYQRRKIKYQGGRTDRFETVSGDIAYVINRKIRANATIGSDSNDFSTNRNNRGGIFWTLGGTWTPSPRTSVTGSYGDRFFGKNFNVNASHSHRRWNFDLQYSEAISSNNQFQGDQEFVPLNNPFGDPIFDALASSAFGIPLNSPSLRNEAFLSKSLATGINYRLRRGTIRFKFTEDRRTFEVSDTREKIRVLTAGFDHRLSPRLQFRIDGNWRQADEGRVGSGDLVNLNTSLRYSLGPHTDLRLLYQFSDQADSERGRAGYTEHSMTAGLVFSF